MRKFSERDNMGMRRLPDSFWFGYILVLLAGLGVAYWWFANG